MKNRLVRLLMLTGYLSILLFSVEFHWTQLLDWKLLSLVAVGMVCLSVPELLKNHGQQKLTAARAADLIGKNAISAGILQTFLLFFSDSPVRAGGSNGVYLATLCFRPLFYGYCFYVLLQTEEKEELKPMKKEEKAVNLKDFSLQFHSMGLTPREAEIAELLLKGISNHEIGEKLCISETTVKKHVSNIFKKLNIKRREQLLDAVMKRNSL